MLNYIWDAIGKIQTVGNSSGQTSQFHMQINCKDKKKSWRRIYEMKDT